MFRNEHFTRNLDKYTVSQNVQLRQKSSDTNDFSIRHSQKI